jgi:predicted Rossmann fold nucleotide-binding protein DprA/Smf involved in DNA uptake
LALGERADDAPRLLIVGPRRPSPHEVSAVQQCAAALAAAGCVLACRGTSGVEAAACRSHLAAGGRPVLWLDRGVERLQADIAALAAEVSAAGGVLCSAFAPGQPFARHQLRATLRAALGWCDALLVVGGELGGGTARAAVLAWQAGVPTGVVAAATAPTALSELATVLAQAGCPVLTDDLGLLRWCAQPRQTLQPRATDASPPVPAALRRSGSRAALRRPCLPPPDSPRPRAGLQSAALPVQPVRARASDPGPDAPLHLRLQYQLALAEPAGLSLEALATGLGVERGAVAEQALMCAMTGTVRREAGGVWRAA